MKYNSIKPGAVWLDTAGKRIEAHGGSLIYIDGVYYWYGEDKSKSLHGSGIWHNGVRLYSSTDLYNWERHPSNPMVVDGFDARDPMVMKIDGRWVMYYTGNVPAEKGNHVVAAVFSDDLIHWGEKRIVFTDPGIGTIGGPCESPFVVHENGSYYLFIGPRNAYNDTHIYKSDDPYSFNMEQDVGNIPAHALEVVKDGDDYYVTRAGWGEGGLYIAPFSFG